MGDVKGWHAEPRMACNAPTLYRGDVTDLAQALAERFVAIRKAVAGTQERFAETAGIRQATVSKLETAQAWKVLAKRMSWLKKAGVDPRELIPIDGEDAEMAEIRSLLPLADGELRKVILTLLRRSRHEQAARAE